MVISKLTSRTSFERLALGSIRSLAASGKATRECGTRDLWSLSSTARLMRSSFMPHILRLLAETLRKPFACRVHLNSCWTLQTDHRRALELARVNVANRPTRRAFRRAAAIAVNLLSEERSRDQ